MNVRRALPNPLRSHFFCSGMALITRIREDWIIIINTISGRSCFKLIGRNGVVYQL